MKRNIGGSRRNTVENRDTLEYFLSLLDEAESLIKGDVYRERKEIVQYSLQKKQETENKATSECFDAASSCHECPLFRNRHAYAEPLLSEHPSVLFIAPYPEGNTILSPAAHEYFVKWFKAIHLERKDVALTTLIKCPSPLFEQDYANKCKRHVKKEMESLRPKAMVLLGEDASRYMLRRRESFDAIRKRRWLVNGIPVYCTYHPEDLVRNQALRRDIWEDLQLIAKELAI